MLKKSLLALATVTLLGSTSTLQAHGDDRCLDTLCQQRALFVNDEPAAGGTMRANAEVVAAPRYGQWGIDTAGMDTSVRPGVDFFRYISGKWDDSTEIPSDRSNWGSFAMLRDLSELRVHRLLQSYPLGNPASDGDAAKIAALYQGFMNEERIEALGAAPLQPLLEEIRAIGNHADAAAAMASPRLSGTLFGIYVGDDQRDPERYTLYMGQSGLGLSDREMYLQERFAPQRERYQQYVAQMLELAGWENPQANAAAIVAFETQIAQAHWTRADSRDRDKTYNPVEMEAFDSFAPGMAWQRFFTSAGVTHAPRVVVRQNTAIARLAQIFADTDINTLKAWMAYHTTNSAAPLLSRAFSDAHFEFQKKFLSGQPEQQERWKRAVSYTEQVMGEAIGRDFVQLYFPADAKAKMDALVANVRVAMAARLDALEWMSPETKREAHAKLANFGLKIGHPDTWRDYSALQIANDDVFGNALRSRQFEWDYRRARIGQPVDKGEWGMTPQTVNAYYNSVKNEIVFPAAILQPPFFDPQADMAVNYGAIGGVIGHEIIHGFDDQGRKSDGQGMLRDWWTAEDAAKFEVQAAKLGAQYEAYQFPDLPGMHINGRVSMGENIGDLGGIMIALEAYRRSLNNQPAPVIDGFTGEQRFFAGWAQVWRIKYRTDALRQQLINGPHSPGQIRAFAPLRNVDAWYEAFGITDADPLWIAPENRVRIW